MASNLSLYNPPSFCSVKSDGNFSSAQFVWPRNMSSKLACLTPLELPFPGRTGVFTWKYHFQVEEVCLPGITIFRWDMCVFSELPFSGRTGVFTWK